MDKVCDYCRGDGWVHVWGPSSCAVRVDLCCGGCYGPAIDCPKCGGADFNADPPSLSARPEPIVRYVPTLAERVLDGLCVCGLPRVVDGERLDIHGECCPF